MDEGGYHGTRKAKAISMNKSELLREEETMYKRNGAVFIGERNKDHD